MRPKLGCVPFLNAKPLVAWFSAGDEPTADVVFEEPSLLGAMVDRGEVDAAIASSFFAVADPSLRVAGGVSISSRGPVQSVRLFSKAPFTEIRSVALDKASMTSNHLALILLSQVYGVTPVTSLSRADLSEMLLTSDAAVMIGDAGMAATGEGLHVMDLGEEWTRWTSLPFVWAFWVGRGGLNTRLAEDLRSAKDYGVRNLAAIALDASMELGMPYEMALHYLQNSIDFDLADKHWEGFAMFGKKCVELGFVKSFRLPEIVAEPSARAGSS